MRIQTSTHRTALRSLTLTALAGLLLLSGCALWRSGVEYPPQVQLTILSTNDFHGALETTSKDRDSGRPIGGASYLAAAIAREQAKNPDGTLLLDAGDIYQGTALSNLTEGRAAIDFMNEAGYDAAALGNHEFDWGISTMEDRLKQAEFPILCANVEVTKSRAPPSWAKPYHIEERMGVRIAIVGLITPSTPRVTLPQNVAHLTFLDPVEVANQLIAELVPAKADMAVILAHIGGFQNDGAGTPIEGHMVELATEVEGESAVIGGHTHRIVAGIVGGTVMLEAGSSGRWLARADLTFDRASRQVLGSSTEIVTVFADEGEPDDAVDTMVARYREEVAPILDEVIGEASVDLTTRRDESPMGNLMTDIIRVMSQSDVAFQNPGGVRAPVDAGPIRYSDVYRVMPFDNTIVIVELSGQELHTLLEEAVGDGSFLHVSGLRYVADYSQPSGSRVTEVQMLDGSRLDADGTYSVAINNFMAQGGDNLPIITDRPDARDSGMLVREAMSEWIRSEHAAGRQITAAVEGRVTRQNRSR